ncbi:FUSC family protein [Clostridium sp. D53t1_180928_C8]|uniref:FUSC family protein n=1 Tax=Clostridium sp. D53t1_180928_C8 TaxID=2787101 RepID=UPI0018A9D042|nr:FUSC family protein [Clostridium sp. D53t1_180928_C8]
MDNLKNKSLDSNFLNEISTVLNDMKDNKSNINISNFEDKYKNSDISKTIDIYDFIGAIKVFNTEIKNFDSASNKQQNTNKELSIPDEFMKLHINKNFISLKNTRIAYGLRLGLMFSITFFIVRLFDIKHGEWAAYTVFALIQPHLEFTVNKSKKRIFGTILGALIVGVFFSLTSDPTLRMLLLIFSGYFMSYISDYKYLAVCITIAAIASAAANVPNANPIILSRVALVIIGILLAIIANHIVFPRRLIDEEENLNNIQKHSSRKMMGEVLLNEGSENASVI